jgi:hypothetical protein
MNRLLFILLLSSQCLWAQTEEKPYFQQEVNSKIEVKLDDKNHMIRGFIEMEYTNNSPDSLDFIYIHLWPNAYKNPRTAFAQQKIENGDRKFYFSPKEERGYIDSLKFQVDGQELKWRYYADQPDIAKVILNSALAPGATISIKTPMRVKIPASVSRLGHVDQSYQMTQWYPKPAVYDREGWHPMPYLDQGEFYSEFGSYDVKITLPTNYYVGATGLLQNEEEKAFIEERIKFSKKQDFDKLAFEDQAFPESDSTYKTIHYKAENVHDFAWFADKRFYVLKDKATLASGNTVDCYVFFTNEEANLWKEGAMYTRRSVEYYSKVVGEYPYPHATAVQSALSAGGGMEYPMITVIGLSYSAKALDNVIAHEVGHNWFYGILASNERTSAWMDEGFNSYVESRYMDEYYNNSQRSNYLSYLVQARARKDQASATSSEQLTNFNYFLGAYSKPTLILRYLETYLGTEEMDRVLNQYYENWKFKHPRPIDVENAFEKESGKDLDWVFKELFGSSKHLDYGFLSGKVQGKQISLKVKNKAEVSAPFEIALVNEKDEVVDSFWFDGLAAGQDTILKLPFNNTYGYRIDASREMPDLDRLDNLYRPKSFKKIGIAPSVKFLLDTRFPEYPAINLFPVVGGNTRDGAMLGMAIYNLPIPAKRWEYALMPLFGVKSKSLVGMGEVRYNGFPKSGAIQNWSIGLGLKSFHGFDREVDSLNLDYQLRYSRLNPNFVINFRKKSPRAYASHQLRVDNLIILEEDEIFEVGLFEGKENKLRTTHRIGHRFDYRHPITPFDIHTQFEYANYNSFNAMEHYTKLTVEGNFTFFFAESWAADLRVFVGGFPTHTDRDFGDFPMHLVSRNTNDYHYDEFIWGRRESSGYFPQQQVSLREGGFKTPIDIAQATTDGQSNSFIFALNFKTNIPIKLPFRIPLVALKPYADLGYFKNTQPSVTVNSIGDELFANAGLMIDIWEGAAGIYFPLLSTNNLNTFMQQRGNFWRQIGLSLDLNRLYPKAVAEEVLSGF